MRVRERAQDTATRGDEIGVGALAERRAPGAPADDDAERVRERPVVRNDRTSGDDESRWSIRCVDAQQAPPSSARQRSPHLAPELRAYRRDLEHRTAKSDVLRAAT